MSLPCVTMRDVLAPMGLSLDFLGIHVFLAGDPKPLVGLLRTPWASLNVNRSLVSICWRPWASMGLSQAPMYVHCRRTRLYWSAIHLQLASIGVEGRHMVLQQVAHGQHRAWAAHGGPSVSGDSVMCFRWAPMNL